MNWNLLQAMFGDAGFFIDRKSEKRWELWYTSPLDGHRNIGSRPSAEMCKELITQETFAEHGITLDANLVSAKQLIWVRASPCT